MPDLHVDALVFDMDGLLLNTETLARRALMQAGQTLNLAMTEEFCASLIGIAADGVRQRVRDHHGNHSAADQFFDVASVALAERIEAGELALRPGVLKLLDALDRQSIPRAVATSSGHDKAHQHLAVMGIASRFNHIVTRDDVSAGKPAPDLFLEAARRLGVSPERCLALEDSYNGVRAAHAANMPVIMIPDLLTPTDEMRAICLTIFDSLDRVTDSVVNAP